MLVCIWLKLHALSHAFTVETNPIVIYTNKLHWICTWNMLIFMHICKISLRLPKDCHFHPPLLEADVRSPFAAEIFGKGKLTVMEYSWSRLKMRLRSTFFYFSSNVLGREQKQKTDGLITQYRQQMTIPKHKGKHPNKKKKWFNDPVQTTNDYSQTQRKTP